MFVTHGHGLEPRLRAERVRMRDEQASPNYNGGKRASPKKKYACLIILLIML
jgi:hypothetical protein